MRVIVAHGGDTHRSIKRFLRKYPDFVRGRDFTPKYTRHTSNRAFILSPEGRAAAFESICETYRDAMRHVGLKSKRASTPLEMQVEAKEDSSTAAAQPAPVEKKQDAQHAREHQGARRYWLASQSTNFPVVITTGTLGSLPRTNGAIPVDRLLLKHMEPGDFVFHYKRPGKPGPLNKSGSPAVKYISELSGEEALKLLDAGGVTLSDITEVRQARSLLRKSSTFRDLQ